MDSMDPWPCGSFGFPSRQTTRSPCIERIPSMSRADGSFITTYVTEPLARTLRDPLPLQNPLNGIILQDCEYSAAITHVQDKAATLDLGNFQSISNTCFIHQDERNTSTNRTSAQNVPYPYHASSRNDLPQNSSSIPTTSSQLLKPQLPRHMGSRINTGINPSEHVGTNDALSRDFRPLQSDSMFQQNFDFESFGASVEMMSSDVSCSYGVQDSVNLSPLNNTLLVPQSGKLPQSIITTCSITENECQLNSFNSNEYHLQTESEFPSQLCFESNNLQNFGHSENSDNSATIQIPATTITMGGQLVSTLSYNNETGPHGDFREDGYNLISSQRRSDGVVRSEVPNRSNSPSMYRISDANAVSPTIRTHRFCCPHPSCADRSFGRRSDRDRHVRKHSMAERTYACPKPSCGKRFYRKDKLLDHSRHGHRPKNAACTCNASRC